MAGVWATGSSVSHDNPAFGVPGHSAGSDAPSAVLIDSKDAIDGGGGGEPGGRSGSVSSVMSAEAGAGAGGGRKRTVSTLRSVVARMRSAGMIPAGSGAMAPPEPGARFAAAARGALEAHKKARRESRGVPLLQAQSVYRLVLGEAGDAPPEGMAEAEEAKRFNIAARFVRDALEARQLGLDHATQTGAHALVSRVIHSAYYRIWLLTWICVHLLLILFESSPAEVAAGIPSPLWCGVVEGIALGVYFLDIGALARVFGASHFKDKLWDSGFLVMALLCGLDWLLVYPCGLYSIARFSRPLRSLLLIAKLQVIRRLLATMLKTTPKMKDVVIVFVAFMFVYAVLGVQLFSGPDYAYSSQNDNFRGFGAAVLAVYVLTTTESYPAVMMPAFKVNETVAVLFFFSACLIFLWLILPVGLATVYSEYVDMQKRDLAVKKTKAQRALLVAYHVLHDDAAEPMSCDRFARFLAVVRPKLSREHRELMFNVLDSDASGSISIREFLQLPSVLKLPMPESAPDVNARRSVVCSKTCGGMCRCCSHPVTRFISFSRGVVTVPWFFWWCQFGVYSGFITATLSSAGIEQSWLVCVAAQGYAACAGELLMVIEYISLVSAVVALSDVAIHGAAAGLNSTHWRSRWVRFDAVVVVLNFFATLLLCTGGTLWGGPFGTVLKLSRPLRVLRFASLTRTIQKFFALVAPIVTLVFRFGLVYWLITYAYAVIGLEIFGTVASPNDDQQLRDFSTFAYSFVALFQLTVSNNWNDILYPNITALGTRWGALYFVSYMAICATLMVNIVTGVIIENYESSRRELEEAAAIQATAKMLHDAAVIAERERTRLQSMASSSDLHSFAEQEEITKLMALCLRMVRGGLVDTHKFRLTRYANTIVGCEAVDFLVEEGFASDREEGIRVCQSMLRFWFFAPAFDAGGAGEPPREPAATPPQPLSGSGNPGDGAPGAVFADEYVFYRVDPTPKAAKRAGVAASAEVAALQGRAATAHLSAEEVSALRESLDMVEDELRKHAANMRKRAELKRLRGVSASSRMSLRGAPRPARPAPTVRESTGGGSDDEDDGGV